MGLDLKRFLNRWKPASSRITLKAASHADSLVVARMQYDCACASGRHPRGECFPSFIQQAEAIISEGAVMLACDGDNQIGCVCLLIVDPDPMDARVTGLVHGLWVDPSHRDTNASVMLIHAAHAWLKSAGCHLLRVNVDEGNTQVLRNYEGLGMKVIGSTYTLEVDL